jgi:acetolactate synthase-1/2/3 large subunit
VVNGDGAHALIVACQGSSAAGLISFDDEGINLIDTAPSRGLALAQGRMLRLLCRRDDAAAPGELLVYDSSGVERYYRLDAFHDPLDIVWDGEHFILVSASQNSLLWLATNGEAVRVARLPGEPDSWHANSLLLHRGELLVAAFGRFHRHQEWIRRAGEPCGIIFSHETGKDVITGLERPYRPRILDGCCLVCNSGTRELFQIDVKSSRPNLKVPLENCPRALAFSDRYIFVAESASDNVRAGDSPATITILDRSTLSVIDRIPVPVEEVCDLLIVPRDLLSGLRRGFRTQLSAARPPAYHALGAERGLKGRQSWNNGDLLPVQDCATRIFVEIEPLQPLDCFLRRTCVVENRGSRAFVSAKPYPVVITYKWMNKQNAQYIGTPSMATRLPAAVPPGGSIRCSIRLRTPSVEGRYVLHVSLFQKGNGFFGKVDTANAFKTEIWVHRAEATKQ